jgi:hypothetical protein
MGENSLLEMIILSEYSSVFIRTTCKLRQGKYLGSRVLLLRSCCKVKLEENYVY